MNRLSRAHERYRRQTVIQTDGRQQIANVNVSSRSLKRLCVMHLKTLLKILTQPGRVVVLAGPGFRPAGRAWPDFRLDPKIMYTLETFDSHRLGYIAVDRCRQVDTAAHSHHHTFVSHLVQLRCWRHRTDRSRRKYCMTTLLFRKPVLFYTSCP